MTDLETREFEVRLADEGERTVTGIAVPWDDEIQVGGIRERFSKGAVKHGDVTLLMYGHAEPIGKLTAFRDTPTGHEITAKISATPRGDEVHTLLRDGVLTKFSIGFRPVLDREDDGVIIREEIDLREVSIVPIPAYQNAAITAVRSETSAAGTEEERKDDIMTDSVPAAEVVELRAAIEEIDREVKAFATREPETPAVDTRTAGEILKAIAAGDDATIRHYNEMQARAYTGGTTADAPIKDAWVGDLTRIFDASSGVLAETFSTGNLPATGMNIEFAELATNTVAFDEQLLEGDDLAYGKVTLTTQTAAVKTYGGYVQLTRQAIERSSLPILNRSLEALAMAAGVRKKAELRAAFVALVAARVTAGDTVDIAMTPTAGDWLDAVVDAAINFEGKGGSIDALVVSADVFKALNALETTGHRVFRVDGHERTAGELDLTALRGDIASVRVLLDTGATGNTAAFVNGRGIRQYDSALINLQDENVINLSKDFSAYRYGAIAAEIPGFVVPVEFAAA